MGRIGVLKWEKSQRCAPVNNIISSDFPKYNPTPWKFMDGRARVAWLLSYEYQRMWLAERDLWQKKMYPENTVENVDIVKRYVLTFKTAHQPPKAEKKKPFRMKRFENIGAAMSNKRASGDKAMSYLKEAPKKPTKESEKEQ